jgi:hypothetical protein
MSITQSLIDKTWKYWAEWFYKNFDMFGKEIHHVFGRWGIFKCCPLFLIPLTKTQHNDYKLLKKLREEKRELAEKVKNNYVKVLGCQKIIDKNWCLDCPMKGEKNESTL